MDTLSVWLEKLPSSSTVGTAMVVVASKQHCAFSEDGLCRFFNLTKAEARLVQHLTLGRSLDEASIQLAISSNTAKTQLKNVFAKFGVRRQLELIQCVYSSPLWLNSQALEKFISNEHPLAVQPYASGQSTHRLVLQDRRTLTYTDRGVPHGVPVVFAHGLVGSRHMAPPDDEVLMTHGIRLITPDRPGFGDSDRQEQRTISDWAADLRQLLDDLGISQCVVIGCSTGSSYALACAQQLPDRVYHVVLVGAVPPFEHMVNLLNYYSPFRHGLLVARYMPLMLLHVFRMMTKDIRKNVHRYLSESLLQAPESDRAVFVDPRLRANATAALMSGASHGEKEMMHEMLLCANDWGFRYEEITTPITFWHGDCDQIISLDGAKRLAQHFPHANFYVVPKAGHYLIYSHWSDILCKLLDR